MNVAPPYTCPYCDKQIPSGRERCPECGAPLVEGSESWLPVAFVFLVVPLLTCGGCVGVSLRLDDPELLYWGLFVALFVDVTAAVTYLIWRKNN